MSISVPVAGDLDTWLMMPIDTGCPSGEYSIVMVRKEPWPSPFPNLDATEKISYSIRCNSCEKELHSVYARLFPATEWAPALHHIAREFARQAHNKS